MAGQGGEEHGGMFIISNDSYQGKYVGFHSKVSYIIARSYQYHWYVAIFYNGYTWELICVLASGVITFIICLRCRQYGGQVVAGNHGHQGQFFCTFELVVGFVVRCG